MQGVQAREHLSLERDETMLRARETLRVFASVLGSSHWYVKELNSKIKKVCFSSACWPMPLSRLFLSRKLETIYPLETAGNFYQNCAFSLNYSSMSHICAISQWWKIDDSLKIFWRRMMFLLCGPSASWNDPWKELPKIDRPRIIFSCEKTCPLPCRYQLQPVKIHPALRRQRGRPNSIEQASITKQAYSFIVHWEAFISVVNVSKSWKKNVLGCIVFAVNAHHPSNRAKNCDAMFCISLSCQPCQYLKNNDQTVCPQKHSHSWFPLPSETISWNLTGSFVWPESTAQFLFLFSSGDFLYKCSWKAWYISKKLFVFEKEKLGRCYSLTWCLSLCILHSRIAMRTISNASPAAPPAFSP